jgi:hypothetical protein
MLLYTSVSWAGKIVGTTRAADRAPRVGSRRANITRKCNIESGRGHRH